ncbi:hypothetical protein [Niallia taxi]|uniref:hypothetical protein n=1 Tax=Niallia taxi TaxID=2499688 RepID=UPI00300BA0F0
MYFYWKNGIPVQAIEADKNIAIQPMSGNLLCGQWPQISTLGRWIESGLTMQREDFYKVDSTYRYPGFFANSEERAELLQREFESIVQLDRAPLDYSNVDFLMANDYLMVGKFRTGSTEMFEQTQYSIESGLSMESENYTSLQEELARTGQFFVGSKVELERIQKEYLRSMELRSTKDISLAEYMATRNDLNLNFLVGSKEIFEQDTRSTSSSLQLTDAENTTISSYKLTGQFYAGKGE